MLIYLPQSQKASAVLVIAKSYNKNISNNLKGFSPVFALLYLAKDFKQIT